MIPMTLAEVAAATDGRIAAQDVDLVIDGPVVTDSRAARRGSLYVARVGVHADGHGYAAAAHAAGAVAALTARRLVDLPCVVVEDTQLAFGHLARAVLGRATPLVIGITGSSGKTSTKDLLAHVLSDAGETIAPVDSLNGEIGVPLTVCRVTRATRHLIVEMGARGVGHICYLTRIAPPRIGVVLNVGAAHLGEFGGVEQIAAAKAELVHALPDDGVAILNADDPRVAAMAAHTAARVVKVGRSHAATVRADRVTVDELGRASFDLVAPQGVSRVTLRLHGEHHVGNALAVAAVAIEAGMSLSRLTDRLASATPVSRWRMEVTRRPDGVTVVNDAYNANPDSMAAALRALSSMSTARDGSPRRTWAVLGQMLELGEESTARHEQVGRLAADLGIHDVVAVGAGASAIADGAVLAGMPTASVHRVSDADTAYEMLEQRLGPADVVLFKSSRDAGLRWLGDRVAGREVGS